MRTLFLHTGTLVTLRSGPYAACVSPTAGGRLTDFWYEQDGCRRDLIVPLRARSFDPHRWPKAGAFPMAPFANRLPRGGFRFDGRIVDPAAGPDGFAVHGFAHRREWRLVACSDAKAELAFVHDGSSENWPWAFSARQTFSLDARGLVVCLTLKNLSRSRMPVGMGLHPYHPMSPDAALRDLAFHARERAALDAEGRAQPGVAPASCSLVPGDTVAFAGWSGHLALRRETFELRVDARGWEHLVLHRAKSGAYVCVEPVSVLPGALAASDAPPGAVLLPDEERSATWACSATALSPPP